MSGMTMMEQAALKMLVNMTGLTPETMQSMANQAMQLLGNLDGRLKAIEDRQEEILTLLRGDMPQAIVPLLNGASENEQHSN